MGEKMILSGNYAAAYGAKLCRPAVIAAYPITPQTTIMEKISQFISDGELTCEFMSVESEHSALSALYGAEAAGLRTFTASSAQGLAYMHEILFVTAGARLPIGMVIVNRALAAPVTIEAEWNDAMPERDSGWIISWCESAQEVLDSIIMNYKIGEDRTVSLPQFCCLDAFFLSHTYEAVDVPGIRQVDDFLPPLKLEYVLDVDRPLCFAPYVDNLHTMEYRWQTEKAMQKSRDVIKRTVKEFNDKFGRTYGNGLIEEYRMDGAEVALVTMGSVSSTCRAVVDLLRKENKPVGLVKIRYFRPFPSQELYDLIKNIKVVGSLERSASFGSGGPLYLDVKSCVYGKRSQPMVIGFIGGLGGRDLSPDAIRKCYEELLAMRNGQTPEYVVPHGETYYKYVDVRER